MAAHSKDFLRVRDALLALDDGDRVPLARLMRAMTEPQSPLSGET